MVKFINVTQIKDSKGFNYILLQSIKEMFSKYGAMIWCKTQIMRLFILIVQIIYINFYFFGVLGFWGLVGRLINTHWNQIGC